MKRSEQIQERVFPLVRHTLRTMRKRAAQAVGVTRGALYRFRGTQPDPDVADDIIADRVRTALGGITHRLDIPHVHVTVSDHVAFLHGDVADQSQVDELERAVLQVSGVDSVVSQMHMGLLRSDTRPSQGVQISHHESRA